MARLVLIIYGLLNLISFSYAHSQVSHERKLLDKKFPASDKCSLTRFSVATYDNEFIDFLGEPGRDRHRMIAAIWETSDPSCLQEYGMVQFIRGCIYNRSRDPKTGEEEIYFGMGRDNRGRFTIFKHPKWEVDSVDLDPLYSSYDAEDATPEKRFDWHKFSRFPLLLKPSDEALAKDQKYFFNSKNYNYVMNAPRGTLSQVFVTDLPSGSSYDPNGALGREEFTISSLEFKTCLYKTSDVPLMADPAWFDQPLSAGGPIQCFDWSDKISFNHERKEFERTETLDPTCL